MRYLRKQVLNRRAPYDTRFYMDATDGIVLANSNNITLPKSSNTIVSPQSGMMRYNSSTNEVEVYQGASATWRAIRYKESTGITQQSLGNIDGYTIYYGPLNPAPPTVVQTGGGGTNVAWGPQNILVIVENVIQVGTTNYTITQNPTATVATSATTSSGNVLTFASTATIPNGAVVTGSANIPGGTTATVTSATQVTLSANVTGAVNSGTSLTFTATAGYYVTFVSDAYYLSLLGKPITVLIGFDQ